MCPIGARFSSIPLNAHMNILPSMSTLRICSPNNSSKLTLALCLLQVATYHSIKTHFLELLVMISKQKQIHLGEFQYLMSTFNNRNMITICCKCVISVRSKSSNLLWELRTNEHQTQLSTLPQEPKQMVQK